MKQIMKKTISLALAMIMLFSCATTALAGETDQMNETNADTVTLSATDVTLALSENAQIVNISLLADKNICVAGLTVNYVVSDENGNVTLGTGVAGNGLSGAISAQGMNVSNGNGVYMTYDSTNEGYTLCTVPVTIGANVTGTYTVTFKDAEICDAENGDGYTLSTDSVTATITVTEAAPAVEGYTAQIATSGSTVTINEPVVVNIGVGHDKDTVFNASEIVLTYDPEYLSVDTSKLEQGSYTNVDGVLTVEDFDKDHNMGTGVYSITFNTLKTGETTVTLDSAKFIKKENASKSDLMDATITTGTVAVTIEGQTVDVSQSSDSEGLVQLPSEAAKGEDFKFTVADYNLYNYEVKATVNGTEVTVTSDNQGGYTIAGNDVQGDIVITATRTGKQFVVKVEGDDTNMVSLPEGNPTYGVDYVFTMPANQAETATQAGYTYSATITIAGSEYSASATGGQTFTILGGQIVGDVTITVTKTEVPANGKTVSITGEDVKFADGSTSTTVSPGTELTIVLTPEAGYDYVIKVNGQAVELSENKYTFTVQDATTIVVEKSLATTDENGDSLVAVSDYVQLNSTEGNKLWLVTFKTTLENGKIPTYDGTAMYYSEKYEAYCYLVKATSLDAADAAGKLDADTATAENVSYNGNVNKTANDTVDAADAQFVANMYNAMYTEIDQEVTMPMFLSADMDGSGKLTVDDAKTIILEKVLKISNNT